MHKSEKWDGYPQNPGQSGPHELKDSNGISVWAWWLANTGSPLWAFFSGKHSTISSIGPNGVCLQFKYVGPAQFSYERNELLS